MTYRDNPARIIGVLLLVQFIGGISVNLFLTAPLFGVPGFIVNGAIYSQQIGVAALAGLLTSGLTVAVAIVAFTIFHARSKSLALGFLSLAIVGLSVTAVEMIGMMSLVSFSEAYSQVNTAVERELFETFKFIAASARKWAHYTNLVLSGATIFIFFTILYRFTLVPRIIAGFGLIAVVLQLISVSMPFLGHSVIFPMLAPLALTYIVLALWLIIKGMKLEA